MKDFNEFIESRKPLQRVMDSLNESDGIMLECMFYDFAKQQIIKAKNLTIPVVVGQSKQFKCQREFQGIKKCSKQCIQCDLAYRNYSI